jgi:hypothetical protein
MYTQSPQLKRPTEPTLEVGSTTKRTKVSRCVDCNELRESRREYYRVVKTEEHNHVVYDELRNKSDLKVRVDPTKLFTDVRKKRSIEYGDDDDDWLTADPEGQELVILVERGHCLQSRCHCRHERLKVRFSRTIECDADTGYFIESWVVVESVPHGLYQVGEELVVVVDDRNGYGSHDRLVVNGVPPVAVFRDHADDESEDDDGN